MTTDEMGAVVVDYPVRFDIARPAAQSRLTNFPLGIGGLIRLLLLIPHFIILYFFQLVAQLLYLIATFAILFTGKFPDGMRNLVIGYHRWTANVYSYLAHTHDSYPPFTPDAQPGYPVTYEVDPSGELSRLLNFPFLGIIIKFILTIPHMIVLVFLILAAYVVVFIATFAILFTGSFPEGMHKFLVGVGRWAVRVQAYQMALTDKYPPFSTN